MNRKAEVREVAGLASAIMGRLGEKRRILADIAPGERSQRPGRTVQRTALRTDLERDLEVSPIDEMLGDDPKETLALKEQHREACRLLRNLEFVADLHRVWYGTGFGGIVAVFLAAYGFEEETFHGWMVCGDIPWLFAPLEEGDTPTAVLERYVRWVREWNESDGVEPDNCFIGPFHPELKDELEGRLRFIETRVLPLLRERAADKHPRD